MESLSYAPVPVNIHQWIRSADRLSLSTDDYVQSAVKLSCLLTKHLMQLIAAAEITLPDIIMDKLIILVQSAPTMASASRLVVQGVHFQVDALGAMIPRLTMMPRRAQTMSLPSSSRATCAALGNILLEIFSKGRSGTPGTCSPHGPTNASNRTQNGNLIRPPPRKRKVSMLMADSISSTANALLLEVGNPVSICQLTCDLLDAIDEPCPDSALTSLEDVLQDLTRMNDDPQRFLFDCTCSRKALDNTRLVHSIDIDLFGRENELNILMNVKNNISNHVGEINTGDSMDVENAEHGVLFEEINFQCEIIMLAGYAGIGKSSLLQSLMNTCREEQWFVLKCKFEKQSVTMNVLAKAFDDLFGTWASSQNNCGRSHLDPAMITSFQQACNFILSTTDKEGLCQMCEIIPNLRKISPQLADSHSQDQVSSSIDKVGFAKNRRVNLFQVLFKSLCSSGRPVLVTHDDLQWASTLEGMKDLIDNYMNVPCAIHKGARNHGLMVVGTFRNNEISENRGIINTINSIQLSKRAKVTGVEVGELTKNDITKLISRKFCLPTRYTHNLAAVVFSKTRGNPFFVVQFLKSIVQNGMLEFSVQSRRWVWDCDVIEMHIISDGVAELLISRFNQLPDHLMQTLKITSCFGSQIDDSTVDLLNTGQVLQCNMQASLQLAINEGIVEKAGPIYQFTHDIIRQTVYESIPIKNRKMLHKTIGEKLLKEANNNPTIHLLAVDQINVYCKDAILGPDESSQIARINATAAKYSISESCFEQALPYIREGMKRLDSNHWEDQYSLSLELHEMSASLSCFNGDISAMSNCLNEIISNVKSFEDSLTSSILLAKLLAASSKYDEAVTNCLSVLSTFGEEFPQDATLPTVLSELSVIQTTLANITVDQVKLLPPMTNKSKLHTMKFLSMLCSYSIISKPLLVPILSCRMVRLTIEEGFCDDSIVGLVTAGYGLYSLTDDIQLSYRIGKVGEALIEESPNMHALRSRLSYELDSTLKATVEPVQSVVSVFPDRYDSAMMAGDIQNAMLSLLSHCIGKLHVGEDLAALAKPFIDCIKQSIKYQQNAVIYLAMSSFAVCTYLSARITNEVDIKSYNELDTLGAQTHNVQLLYQNFINVMSCSFWMRDYLRVAELSAKQKKAGPKRILQFVHVFFEGIALLTLARQTHRPEWKKTGEEALEKMLKWKVVSKWNFESMALLLQAELNYLDGDIETANIAYEASVTSAHEHQFLHYEALALELHGIFCMENQMLAKGMKQLHIALDKYKLWGATRKVEELQFFIDLVDPTYLRRKLKIRI